MTAGYLFPDICAPRAHVAASTPLRCEEGRGGDPVAMNTRFVARLKAWSLYEGESLHGTRGGGALTHAMAGASSQAVDAHVGWAPAPTSPCSGSGMQEHYTHAHRVCTVVGGAAAGAQGVSPAQYRA
jgi:hypothetical protein